jgi:ssDNA-binding replication factor A large subunit
MKYLIAFLLVIVTISCGSVEDRIKEHSYTEEWHQLDGKRYQVYQTKTGKKYIIVFNKQETDLKRKYLK